MRYDAATLGLQPLSTVQPLAPSTLDYTMAFDPVQQVLRVQFNRDFRGSLAIYDAMGKTMWIEDIREGVRTVCIPTRSFTTGLYFTRVQERNSGRVKRVKTFFKY